MAGKWLKLPRETVAAQITAFAHDGRGIAHVNGKPVFIDRALRDEHVSFRYTSIHRDFAEGQLVDVLTPASQRTTPACAHYHSCGGCGLQHLDPAAQITLKQELLVEQLRRIGKLTDFELYPPLRGPVWGYRSKARLGVHYIAARGRCAVGFRERATHRVADLENCPVLHPYIGTRLGELRAFLAALTLRQDIPQVEVAVGDEAWALVIRINRPPGAEDLDKLRKLAVDWSVNIYLQSKGVAQPKPLDGEPMGLLSYTLPDQAITISFAPPEFTQVNVEINRLLVNRVIELTAPEPDDQVLDFFCGVGNFTLPLARKVAQVTGVEGLANLVERARFNSEQNHIGNTDFHLADLTQPISSAPWAMQSYNKVILDPPRSGARELLSTVATWPIERIVYVSCNPATLARDLNTLVHTAGFHLTGVGILDMFPHTAHVESVALLEKR